MKICGKIVKNCSRAKKIVRIVDLFTILGRVERRFSCLRFARNCGIALYFSLVWSQLDRKFSCLRHAQTGRKKLRSFQPKHCIHGLKRGVFHYDFTLFPKKKRRLSVPLRFYNTLRALLRVMHASSSVTPRGPTVQLAPGPSLELTSSHPV